MTGGLATATTSPSTVAPALTVWLHQHSRVHPGAVTVSHPENQGRTARQLRDDALGGSPNVAIAGRAGNRRA